MKLNCPNRLYDYHVKAGTLGQYTKAPMIEPLFVAILAGDLDKCNQILLTWTEEEAVKNVNSCDDEGMSALILAALEAPQNRREIVQLLVKFGANVNYLNEYSDYNQVGSALHAAADRDLCDVAEVLLDNGAKVDALCGRFDFLDKIETKYRTPLLIAAQFGYTNMVKLLHARGAKLMYRDNYGDDALSLACYMEHLDTIAFLA